MKVRKNRSGLFVLTVLIAGVQAIGVGAGRADTPPAAVDLAVVGTWCFSPSARGDATVLTWTINADGSYKRTWIGPNARPDDAGTVTFANGAWGRHSDSGQVEAGTSRQPDRDILILTSNGKPVVWLRHSDAQMVVPTGGAANFDSKLIGTWKGISTLQNRQDITGCTFEADGRYRTFDIGGTGPDETGRFTAVNGIWQKMVDGGGANNGVYKFIDPNIVTIRGKFGWVMTWYRSVPAAQQVAMGSAPAAPATITPPLAPTALATSPSTPAAPMSSPPAVPVPPASPAMPPPVPGLFPVAVPAVSWTGPADEPPVGRWTAMKMGCTATYTFKSDGTSLFDVDAPAFKAVYPNGMPSKYVLRKGPTFCELDLTGTDPAHPMDVKAIYFRISKDKFKVEGDMDAPRPTAFSGDADVFTFAGDAPPVIMPVPPGQEWTGPADELPVGRFAADQNGTVMCCTFNPDGTMLMEWDEPNFKVACPFGLQFRVTLKKGSPICEMQLDSLNPTKPLTLKAIYQRLSKDQFKYQDFGNAPRPAAFAASAQTFVRVTSAPAAAQTPGATPTPAASPAITWTGPVDEVPVGKWKSEEGDAAGYFTFRNDGTALLEIDAPQFKAACPNGLPCTFALRKGSPSCEIDIDSTNPALPVHIQGLYLRISKDEIRLAGGPGEPRPTAFTPGAPDLFTRVADAPSTAPAPAAGSATGAAPAALAPAVPAPPGHVIF